MLLQGKYILLKHQNLFCINANNAINILGKACVIKVVSLTPQSGFNYLAPVLSMPKDFALK